MTKMALRVLLLLSALLLLRGGAAVTPAGPAPTAAATSPSCSAASPIALMVCSMALNACRRQRHSHEAPAPEDADLGERLDKQAVAIAKLLASVADLRSANVALEERLGVVAPTPSAPGPTPAPTPAPLSSEEQKALWPEFRDAAHNGADDEVKRLLARGMDASYRDARHRTALHFAAQPCHIEVVRTLLAAGADVEAMTTQDNTPLVLALFAGQLPCVEALVNGGTNVKRVFEGGSTYLHAAASQNFVEIAQILLAAGADPVAKDEEGRTPRDMAKGGAVSQLLPPPKG